MGWKMRFTYDKHQHPTLNANNQEGDVTRKGPHFDLPFPWWFSWSARMVSASG